MLRAISIGLALTALLTGCWREHDSEWTDLRGGLTDCLVVVFNPGADHRAVYSFMNEHTLSQTPHPRGGYPHRPEIGAVVKVDVQEHVGYQVCFWPKVTADQKAAIRDEMSGDPLVRGIYENVEPSEIDLESRKPG